MPEVFSKDCKINIIEYGSTQTPAASWKTLQKAFLTRIRSFFGI
jgi:hypothetical protein